MADWDWNGEEGCWQLIQRWERWYLSRKWLGRDVGRWEKDSIVLSVAGSPDFRDQRLLARVSGYATRVTELEGLISDYLTGRKVRVYDTAWEGVKLPSDVDSVGVSVVVHPMGVKAELAEISILDLQRSERVQVWVETGYPDPYFKYFVVFEDGVIVDGFGEVW